MQISAGLDIIILEWNLDSKTQPCFPLKWAVIIHSRATDTSVINIHFARFFIFTASQWFLVTHAITFSSHRPHAWEPSKAHAPELLSNKGCRLHAFTNTIK